MSKEEKKQSDDALKSKRKSMENAKSEETLDPKEISSANNWEEADLGDEKRKLKFLKLMGAAKHKNVGDKEVIKKHSRKENEEEKIKADLEKQFHDGLETKILGRHHAGLGFASSGSTSLSRSAAPSAKGTHITFDDDDDYNNDTKSKETKDQKKSVEVTAKSDQPKPPTASASSPSESTKEVKSSAPTVAKEDKLAKYKQMTFIKSSK